MLIGNQIIGFFDQQYLQNKLSDLSDLLFGLTFKKRRKSDIRKYILRTVAKFHF